MQEAWEVLLITEEIWCDVTGTVESDIDDYNWFDLSVEQKAAAEFLGYTEEIWCTVDGAWVCDPEYPFSKYSSMTWDQLPSDIRKLYETLLYTEESWDGDVPSPIEEKDWYDLTEEQRAAAITLGYTEELWCTDEDTSTWACDPISSPTKLPTPPPGEMVTIKVDIMTDMYPGDTSWELVSLCPGGGKIATGGGYSLADELYSAVHVTARSRFRFRIDDSWGDGICCSLDPGSYNVHMDGSLVASGGKFDFSEMAEFGECEGAVKTFKVDILTDAYPEDTSWTLRDTCEGGGEIASGGGYTVAGQLYSKEFSVSRNSAFEFNIKDSHGDGICCSVGDGSYEMYMDGTLVASGGNFGTSEKKIFGECS